MAAQEYSSIGFGKTFYREEIVHKFAEYVKKDIYNNPVENVFNAHFENTSLVDSAALKRYEEYKKFCIATNISINDGTNIKEYIDSVLLLKEYEKYNPFAEAMSFYYAAIKEASYNKEMASFMFTVSDRNEYREKIINIRRTLKVNLSGIDSTAPYIKDVLDLVNFLENASPSAENEARGRMMAGSLGAHYGKIIGEIQDIIEKVPQLYYDM